MRIRRRGRAVNSVTARARSHHHHRHAIGLSAIDGLQVLVVKRVLFEHRSEAADELLIGDDAVLGLVSRDA